MLRDAGGCPRDIRGDVHYIVDLVDCETGVDLLHGRASVLHRIQRLLINIRRLDAINLLLERHDLGARLLEGMLKLFLPPQCRLCRYAIPPSALSFRKQR